MDKLSDDELDYITETTLRHYDKTALDFWEASKGHNLEENYDAFIEALPKTNPIKILDLGCGPGRDLRYFKDLGYEVVGLEGSPVFCEMARNYAECEVWQQNFLNMELPQNHFDGIFANAVLFHIPQQSIESVLQTLYCTLKPNGIMFASNPRKSHIVWYGEHPGTYLEYDSLKQILNHSGFKILKHFYRPTNKPREEQFWIATVSQKIDS